MWINNDLVPNLNWIFLKKNLPALIVSVEMLFAPCSNFLNFQPVPRSLFLFTVQWKSVLPFHSTSGDLTGSSCCPSDLWPPSSDLPSPLPFAETGWPLISDLWLLIFRFSQLPLFLTSHIPILLQKLTYYTLYIPQSPIIINYICKQNKIKQK